MDWAVEPAPPTMVRPFSGTRSDVIVTGLMFFSPAHSTRPPWRTSSRHMPTGTAASVRSTTTSAIVPPVSCRDALDRALGVDVDHVVGTDAGRGIEAHAVARGAGDDDRARAEHLGVRRADEAHVPGALDHDRLPRLQVGAPEPVHDVGERLEQRQLRRGHALGQRHEVRVGHDLHVLAVPAVQAGADVEPLRVAVELHLRAVRRSTEAHLARAAAPDQVDADPLPDADAEVGAGAQLVDPADDLVPGHESG